MLNPVFQLSNFDAYKKQFTNFYTDNIETKKYFEEYIDSMTSSEFYQFFCPVCQSLQKFRVLGEINAASTLQGAACKLSNNDLFCNHCNLNPRQRLTISQMGQLLVNKKNLHVYLMSEIQDSDCFNHTVKHYPYHFITSSEYGDKETLEREKIRFEDVHCLSFDDNFFDIVVSADVFEHVNNPLKGFRELYRVLKPGGTLLLTVPLGFSIPYEHTKFAEEIDGKIIYFREPEYHKNYLVYNQFGLQLLDDLRSLGFSSAVLEIYKDHSMGFGIETPMFRITK